MRNGQPPQGKRPPEPGSAHGFQRWAVLLIAAALIGGLAADALTRESVLWAVVFSLIVAVVALCALAGGLLDDAEIPRRPPLTRRRPSRHSADQPAPVRSDPAPGADLAPPSGERLPESPGPASRNRSWWEQPGAAPSALSAAAPTADDRVPRHARLTSAEFADFGDQTQVAQCPQCGSFHIAVGTQAAPPWHFACHECGRTWIWQPGIPWPSVQVRPNARRPAEKPGW